MSSPATPPASAKRSRAARRKCSSRRVDAAADASESARAPRPAHVPRVSHAEDAARALAAVDAFVPHLERHALAMHDVAHAREALDAALQARPPRSTPPTAPHPARTAPDIPFFFSNAAPTDSPRRNRPRTTVTNAPPTRASLAQEERRLSTTHASAFAAKTRAQSLAAPADAAVLRGSPITRKTAALFRDRGASVEAQVAAADAAAAAAVRRVRAETALVEAQSAAAKIAEENHAVRSVLRVTGAETTVETRGEKTRARTPGRAVEKAPGWSSDSSPEERHQRKKERKALEEPSSSSPSPSPTKATNAEVDHLADLLRASARVG